MCQLKRQQITFLLSVSKWYYCWCLLYYFIDCIILVFIRVANKNNTGLNMRLLNHKVNNRKI